MIEITLIQVIAIWIAIGSFSHALFTYLEFNDYEDDYKYLDFKNLCIILFLSLICIVFWPLMWLVSSSQKSHITSSGDPLDEYDYPTEMKRIKNER